MSRAQVPGGWATWGHAGGARRRWATASLGAALLLSGCGAPALDPDAAASFQASVREIATAAAAGDQITATQLATELRQEVTVARGQGTVTADRATQIQSTIDELLNAIVAEVGQPGPIGPAPVPEPATNTPEQPPTTPAETPTPAETTPPAGPSQDDDEGEDGNEEDESGEDAGPAGDKAQRDAEREREKQQREQEKLEKEQREQAEREQEQREDAADDA